MVSENENVSGLFGAALEIQNYLVEVGQPFVFIGGLALQRWGEPRVTRDVDLTILTRFTNEEAIVRAFLGRFRGRVEDAEAFAMRHRVILAQTGTGIGIDAALGGLPFEESAVDRSSIFEFLPGISLRTVSASDLVILKAFAARPRDWEDIRGIVVRSSHELDVPYIESHLIPLAELKEEPQIVETLRGLLKG